MQEYVTIASSCVSNTIVIEKSRFIAYARGVESVEEAQQFVQEITKSNYDATHNCFAYIVGDRAKFSDDGEPQGTAGMPIYECIKNNHLDNVAVVVTRYFGGIKLGAGGLVRAYSGSCAGVLNVCERLSYKQCKTISIEIDYSLITVAKRAMEKLGHLRDTVYDANVTLKYLILSENYNKILSDITNITLGRAIVAVESDIICPYGEL